MTFQSFANTIPDDSLEEVIMKDGRKIKCKKVSRKVLEGMGSFLPEMKNLAFVTSAGLDFIARCGNTPLYYTNADPSILMHSKDGGVYSATMENGKTISG